MEPLQDKIPVGIITRFLGAGKTTLLNNLIREYPGKRFAIIENEFGEIGLDSELVLNLDNSNICELTNGCICCSLNEDLADGVIDHLHTGMPLDYLLIETTGIADPSTVVQPFFSDQDIRSSFTMDSVICLVDTLHFEHYFKQQEEVHRQVAMADNADIRNHQLIDRHAYRTDKVGSFTLQPEAFDQSGYHQTGPENQLLARYPTPDHPISSYSFQFPGDFDIEKFSYWMEYFLYINQTNALRIKGILSFADNPQKMICKQCVVHICWRIGNSGRWEKNALTG